MKLIDFTNTSNLTDKIFALHSPSQLQLHSLTQQIEVLTWEPFARGTLILFFYNKPLVCCKRRTSWRNLNAFIVHPPRLSIVNKWINCTRSLVCKRHCSYNWSIVCSYSAGDFTSLARKTLLELLMRCGVKLNYSQLFSALHHII